jgi:hypothetical protein
LLRPLPAGGFETGLVLSPRVDRYSRVMVRQCTYSVPARLIGHRVRVLLRAEELVISARGRALARHERSTVKGSTTVVLDHYLEILMRKPGALPGAVALDQARKTGAFTAEHEAFWTAARKAHGDGPGTRALVDVLLLHRHLPREDVLVGLRAVTALGVTNPDVVAVEARRIAETRRDEEQPPEQADEPAGEQTAGRVVSLTERRMADPEATIASLPPDRRPAPSVTAYDELLLRRRREGEPPEQTTTNTGDAS